VFVSITCGDKKKDANADYANNNTSSQYMICGTRRKEKCRYRRHDWHQNDEDKNPRNVHYQQDSHQWMHRPFSNIDKKRTGLRAGRLG